MKKHELQGDSQNLSILQRIARVTSNAPVRAFMYVMGYVLSGFLVDTLQKIAWPWVYLGFPPVIVAATVFFEFKGRRHLGTYVNILRLSADWLITIVIGGLVGAWVTLVEGLLPFYTNLYVILFISLYFGLVLDMFFLQSILWKASKRAEAKVSGKRLF